VRLQAGRWPRAPGEILLERTAAPLANARVDSDISVQMPHGAKHSLHVAGIVHDPSLAPAWQEQTVYGYTTPGALRLLGEDPSPHLLKLTVVGFAGDRAGLERAVAGVADWLRQTGHTLGEVRIPPRQHPHQGAMTSVVRMLLVFSVLMLGLSAILTATLTSSLLAPQVRQIGVMKAIGARSSQIIQIYAGLIAAIGILAVGFGLPLGIAAGQVLAQSTAGLLNLELASRSAPNALYAAQALLGVGLPLAAALLPIMAAARRPVSQTLNEFGAGSAPADRNAAIAWISTLGAGDAAFSLALRNGLRRTGRLALTVGLLAVAGSLFMTSINLRSAWLQNLAAAAAERHFDGEVQFAGMQPEAAVLSLVSTVPGVSRAESWSATAASRARSDGLAIVRTYPDGGHGSLQLQGISRESAFLSPAMVAGHWLAASDPDGAVLNGQALSMFPELRIGDRIPLAVRGHAAGLRLIGIAAEHLTQATVYTSTERFGKIVSEPGKTGGVRFALEPSEARSAPRSMATIERALNGSGFNVARSISQAQIGQVLGGHLSILVFTLVVMSLLMAIVGIMGQGSALLINVLERTREFAVMRVLGARSAVIRRVVVGEALLTAVSSALIAVVLSVPLTMMVVRISGSGSFGPALGTVVMAAAAVPAWLAIVVAGAAAASIYPAWMASKLTIRAALTCP
jgi:putative ABC transport system permease protein